MADETTDLFRHMREQAEQSLAAQGIRGQLEGRLDAGFGYYDRSGEPIDFATWCILETKTLYRTVAVTDLGPYYISTVWLGLDHSFTPGSPPLIFETMVFGPPGYAHDLDCRRYATEEEAHAGHSEFVTLIRACMKTSDELLSGDSDVPDDGW